MGKAVLLVFALSAAARGARLDDVIPLARGTTITALRTDQAGNVYVGGYFKPARPVSSSDTSDAFVAKLSRDGQQTIYRTVLSGSLADQINDIAVAADGSVYALGTTASSNFPVTAGAGQAVFGSGSTKAFFAKFDPTGSVAYASFLGGDADTSGQSIAIDGSGSAFVLVGQLTVALGSYIGKVDGSGRFSVVTTRVGGRRIALDSKGNIYVAGTVSSTLAVPITTGAYQTSLQPSTCPNQSRLLPCLHQFVAKLDPSGQQVLYATFIAGSHEELPAALAVDANGNAYVAGSTTSTDYPVTPSAYQLISNAGPLGLPIPTMSPPETPSTGYVSKLNANGTSLIFSTYLGGSVSDSIFAMALDSGNNVFLAGSAASQDFPGVTGTPDRCRTGSFVTRLDADGSSLSQTQLLYGLPPSSPTALALDSSGGTWVGVGADLAHADVFGPTNHFACAVDSADFAVLDTLVPGQLFSPLGINLGPAIITALPVGGQYPTGLFGISATINGIPAPLLYASQTQINLQAPFELAGQTTARVQIQISNALGTITESRNFAVADLTPSAFVAESGFLTCGGVTIFGSHALALNPDGSRNTCENPAPHGSTVTVFLQGLGVTSPAPVTGAVPASAVKLNLPVTITDGSTRIVGVASIPGSISGVWGAQLQVTTGIATSMSVGGVPLRETVLVIWSK